MQPAAVGSGWGGAHTYECYSLDDYAAGKETTQIEYKYALGSWDYVEKDGACGEIGNRQLTLSYGSNGVQTVNDTILNWRNVSPCGN